MNAFDQFWQHAVSLVWGLPLVILVCSCSLYFLFVSRLKPFLFITHAFALLLGRVEHDTAPGAISHFQALSSALSGTIGMGNIAGVAIAITMGGAGAIFWMWFAGLLGMITKFFTCTLSCIYRRSNADGQILGGPMYMIEMGLGKTYKPLAVMFAIFGMIGCMPLFQSNQLANLLNDQWSVQNEISGLSFAFITGIILIGGIKRIGKMTASLVPFMLILYVGISLLVILQNLAEVPGLFKLIFSEAFASEAMTGGATGVIFREVMITGIKRAVFSNEAGVGTEALVHAQAKTSEPVREGLVAMLGPVFDTLIVCTLTALVILIADLPTAKSGALLTAMAFEQELAGTGRFLLLLIFSLFAISTMITYAFYSQSCAIYLFGESIKKVFMVFYLLAIMLAAIWQQITIVNIIDTMFALMVIPTLVTTVLLAGQVREAMERYFKQQ